MNARHAFAVALVGWYLMAPPSNHGVNHLPERDVAPLNTWKIVDSFQTAAQCRADWESRINDVQDTDQASRKYVESFRCIARDDPQLKSK